MSPQTVQELLRSQHLWRGRSHRESGLATGFEALDRVLPSNGWPRAAVIELVVADWGIGELRLLLPAMRALVAAGAQLAWVAPPYVPYVPALAAAGLDPRSLIVLLPDHDDDLLWSAEKLLQGGDQGMVLMWPTKLTPLAVRRLQLAAEGSGSLGVILHLQRSGWHANTAALRLRLQADVAHGLRIEVLKARGSSDRAVVRLNL